MRFATHLLFGLLIGLIFLDYFGTANNLLFIALVCLGAIMPDIDYVDSKIGRRLKPISRIISYLFGHRGFMHTIFPPLIVFGIASYLGKGFWGFGFLVGYLSHLISDGLTKEGVMAFYPILRLRVRGLVKTGGFWEYIILAALISLVLWKVKGLFF